MLTLRKHVRAWTVGMLVAVYAVVVLAPSLAFSFDGEGSIVHSLTEVHGGLLVPHFHHHDADHKNSGQQGPGGFDHCCGVLSLPGLPAAADFAIDDRICVALIASVREDHHAGCGPIRMERPPRASRLI
jgi:hypothetical protein